MRKLAFFVTAILTSTLAIADAPSERDVKAALEQSLKARFAGRVKVISVEKTDGMQRDLGGTPGYAVDYVGSLEFTEACNHIVEAVARWGGKPDPLDCTRGNSLASLDQYSRSFAGSLAAVVPGKSYGAGEKVKIKATALFLKTEKGWRAVR